MRSALFCASDAIAIADVDDHVTLLNPTAQSLTGWTQDEAFGVPFQDIFTLISEGSRQPVESPTVRALREGVVVGNAIQCLLLSRDRTERSVNATAAPIRNAAGEVAGVVLVLRDVTTRRRQEQAAEAALEFANQLIANLREPFVLLDQSLRVQMANESFYQSFHVSRLETENRSLFELGNGQWNIPSLRNVLDEVLSDHAAFENFEVEHDFPTIGKKVMHLNFRHITSQHNPSDLILLSIEDVTEHRRAEAIRRLEDAPWRRSEVQYRRLFESARDGILILDEKTGIIIDANPFMSDLLGYERDHFLGKELWEIGMFADIEANRIAFQKLQEKGYIRYDHLPMETRDKQRVETEVVSNSYESGGRLVIQCNIRDCSERFRLEQVVEASLREKEVLLKEIHHRVKNNLQVISSLLELQSEHIQDSATIQMFRESRDRVRSMALVHEHLYRSPDLAQLDFSDYIESLALHLLRSHHVDTQRIKLKVNVISVKLSIDIAVPIGLLINELISNCLKHAFQDRPLGQIWIDLRPFNFGDVLLTVKDDGVGIPPGMQEQSAESFGMELIADLVAQLHGRVQFHRDSGTTVRIVFNAGKINPAEGESHT